jgi:hypothetical protein
MWVASIDNDSNYNDQIYVCVCVRARACAHAFERERDSRNITLIPCEKQKKAVMIFRPHYKYSWIIRTVTLNVPGMLCTIDIPCLVFFCCHTKNLRSELKSDLIPITACMQFARINLVGVCCVASSVGCSVLEQLGGLISFIHLVDEVSHLTYRWNLVVSRVCDFSS